MIAAAPARSAIEAQIMIEIAKIMAWPLDARARRFCRLAETMASADVKAAVVDAGIYGDLTHTEAEAIIRALGLESE